jgi:spermidine synthase
MAGHLTLLSTEKWIRRTLFPLFFASGACALIYEVIWVRILTQILGNTTFATSIILASFMAGLAIGSFILGRLIDRWGRPLLIYAVLEAGIALFALVLPYLFAALTPLYVLFCRFLGDAPQTFIPAQVILCFILVLPPTILMGGTLPVLSKFAADRKDTVGKTVGGLYAVNTLGGVTGCFAAGFFLIEAFGIRSTSYLAVITNFVVAAAAFLLSRKEMDFHLSGNESRTGHVPYGEPEVKIQPESIGHVNQKKDTGLRRLVLWAIGLSGFTGLAYEVLWTRLLVFSSTGMIVYTFSAMLTVFLAGFAIGSYIGSLLADKIKRLTEVFAGLQIAVGLLCILTVPLLIRLHLFEETINRYVAFITDPYWQNMSAFFLLSVAFIFVPSLLLGSVFPIAVRIYTNDIGRIGHKVGAVYAANTIGAILGSIAAGFVLVPAFGTRQSLIFTAVINLFIAFLVFFPLLSHKYNRRALISRTAGFSFALLICFMLAYHFWMDDESIKALFAMGNENVKIIYADEGVGGTITVEQMPDYSRRLAINGINVAGTDFKFRTIQALQVHLPLLLLENPQDVLQIGFGSGATTWSISRHNVKHIDVVELISGVMKPAGFFRDVNHDVLSRNRPALTIDDVRSFLVRGSRKYDAILSDSIHPTIAGNGSLYAVEYFRLCKERLKPDGVFSTYLPFYGLTLDDFKIILRSMKKVFPYVYLWHTPAGRNEWSIVMGLNRPLAVDIDKLERRFNRKEIRADLAEIMINDYRQLLSYFLLDNKGVLSLIGSEGQLNTDDNCYLEYVSAKLFSIRYQDVKEILQDLLVKRRNIFPFLMNDSDDPVLKHYILERDCILTGRLLELNGQFYLAKMAFKQAIELNPESEIAWDMLGYSRIAKEILLNAINENPKDYTIFQRLGFLYLSGNNFAEAERQFQKALELKPDAIDTHLGLARAYLEMDQYDESVRHLNIVEQLGPTPWVASKAKNEIALIYARRTAKYLPKSPEVHNRLGTAYWDRGNFDLAIGEFEKVVELQPEFIMARLNLAIRYEELWELKKARDIFEKVLQVDPGNAAATRHLVQIRNKMAYHDLIAYLASQSRWSREMHTGQRGVPYYSRGLEYWGKRQFAHATRKLEKAVKYSPDYFADLVKLYEIQRMYDKAIEALQGIVKSNPQDSKTKMYIMKLNLLKELDKSPKTREEKEIYCQVLNTLGNMYWQEGEFEKAKEMLFRLISLDPDSAVIYVNMGRCYESTGELPEAVASYKKAIKLDPKLEYARISLSRLSKDMRDFGW